MPRNTVLVIKLLVTSAALVWLFHSLHWNIIFDKLAGVNYVILGLSLMVSLICIPVCALRWKLVGDSCGYPITFGDSVRAYFMGSFFSNFLPTGKGGDIARGIIVAKQYSYSLGGIMGTILVERINGLIVATGIMILTSLFVISRMVALRNSMISSVILVLILLIASVICLSPQFQKVLTRLARHLRWQRLRKAIEDIVGVFQTFREKPGMMVTVTGFSLLNQLILIVASFITALAIPGFQAPWYSFAIVIPLICFTALLPSIGGYGVRETGFVVFFGWFGVTEETAATFAILRLTLSLVFSLAGAALFVINNGGRQEKGADNAGPREELAVQVRQHEF